MWSSIVHYTKLAVCDGFARKASDVPRRKFTVRFDDDSLKRDAEREKEITSSKSFKDLAEGIVRSVSLDSIKSLGVSYWWEQGPNTQCRPQKAMRETILVSSELMSLLCGSTAAQGKIDDRNQNILQTIKDACDVDFEIRPQFGGEGMQGLAITGKRQERDRAKRMIVRLGASCRTETLSTVIDSWEDPSSPGFMQVFMSDCAEHEFGTRGFERSSEKTEAVPEQDVKAFFKKQANIRWMKEMDDLNGYEYPNAFVEPGMRWAC